MIVGGVWVPVRALNVSATTGAPTPEAYTSDRARRLTHVTAINRSRPFREWSARVRVSRGALDLFPVGASTRVRFEPAEIGAAFGVVGDVVVSEVVGDVVVSEVADDLASIEVVLRGSGALKKTRRAPRAVERAVAAYVRRASVPVLGEDEDA